MPFEFEWDEAKRLSNIRKHDLDFQEAIELFDDRPVVTVQSSHLHEARFLTTGRLGGQFITVIWTRRSARIRIISVRRARDGERRAYRALHPG